MSEFERQAPQCRLAEIHYGDTLQTIAAREMGDANRWPELVWVNSLTYPYITSDPERVTPGVLLFGSMIKVPSPIGVTTRDGDKGQVYERDCRLTNKLLEVTEDGDIAVVTGVDNLKQQLSHVVITPRGQATRHPSYGCMVWRLLGTVNGPLSVKLGADYVKAALRSDYRVSKVEYSRSETSGDVLRVTARVVAIDGSAVDVVIKPLTTQPTLPIPPSGQSGWSYNYGYNWGY